MTKNKSKSIKWTWNTKEANFLIDALFGGKYQKVNVEENLYRKRGKANRLKSVRIGNVRG